MKCRFILLIGYALVGSALASENQSVPLADVAQYAVEQSKITLPGGAAFHLKATIVETTNPASDYKGEIEEFWVAPDKWRRTITSPNFSQTLIANGDKLSEDNKGDYFPLWLNDLATALFDPLPMLDTLKKLNSQIPKPQGGEHSNSCARLQMKVGAPPAQNGTYLVFCFEGSRGLLQSVVAPGYEADFKDYKSFRGKQVPRRITIDPEPGTTIEAKVTELAELGNPDEKLFAVSQSTPPAERLRSIVVDEATARKLSVSTPDILWPTVRSGKTSGVLSIYVSIDRNGRVRETWPLNSDNAGLEDAAREQVKRWQFKTATGDGAPVQVETILTFAFNTKTGDTAK
jgi:hypothetical protein